MEKAEIDAARAQAVNVAAVLTPLLQALQSANEVLSLASNAEKQKGAFAKDIAELTKQYASLQDAVLVEKAKLATLQTQVAEAESDAKAAINAAARAAKEKAEAAEDAAALRAETAAAAAAAKEAEFTQHIQEVQKSTDAAVAALFTKEQTAAEAAAAAEKKLATIQAQAQKFAASLAG